MKHTLVAAFATSTDANRTVGDLMSRGIAREQIHSVGADSANIHAYDAPYSTEGGTVDREHHEGKVAHFFKSLFGHEPHEEHRRHATAYPEAVRRGSLVIAVDVHDDDQLVRARDALEYNGALNIDDNGNGAGATPGYSGATSPYAGATGGDSHLDKHFAGSASHAGHSADTHRDTGAPGAGTTDTAATGRTADTHAGSGDTGRHGLPGERRHRVPDWRRPGRRDGRHSRRDGKPGRHPRGHLHRPDLRDQAVKRLTDR